MTRVLNVADTIMRKIIIAALLVALSACEPASEQQAAAPAPEPPLSVYTVNYPLAWMAGRIGSEHVQVSFPAPANIDPAFWKPAPAVVNEYQQADLIILNGAGYAAWVTRSSLSAERLIDTSADFSDRLISITDTVRHKHGPEGTHSHGDVAFTVWLDPDLAALQAQAILDALVVDRPEHETEFRQNLEALLADFRDLDARLAQIFDLPESATVVFSHPVYQYLEQAYGVDARTVMWEPDELLTPEDLEALTRDKDDAAMKLLVWEAEPLAANRQALDATGYTSVVFSPVANRPAAGDYLEMMNANIAAWQDVIQ
jgi:zinc transport system substrate-binding protein